jgi:tetratricopeptide (TPR) repeat protein
VKQVVEMGFTREQALNALDATENGTDVSLAIDLLLQDREASVSSPSQQQQRPPRSQRSPPKQRLGTNEAARQMLWGEDPSPAPRSSGSSRKASPRIAQEQEDAEERHTSAQDRNVAFQHQKEKIVSQASELGGFLYKNASLFVKSSREKVEKYMNEMQTEGDRSKGQGTGGGGPSRPKWMTDAPDDHLHYDVEREHPGGKFEKYADESSDEDPEEEKRKEEEFRLERERQRKRYVAEQKASKAAKQQQLLDTSDNYVSPSRRRHPTSSGRSSGRSTPQSPNPNVTPQAVSPKPVVKQRAKRRVVEASGGQVESANAHKQRGNDFFKLGQYSEAEQAYSQAIMQLPERHDHLIILHNNRAAAYFKNGEYKRAVEDSNIVVQLIGNEHVDDTSVHTIQGASISMRDQAVKALLRKAQALESMEKFADAITEYNMLTKIDGGKNTTQIHQGQARCRKSINGAHKAETESMQKAKAPATNGHSTSSNPFSVDFDPISAATSNAPAVASATPSKVDVDKSEAVKQMRAKAALQDAEEEQRLKVVDDVDRRLVAWKSGKEKNLRALLASLDTILWPEATWKGANMSELIDPKRCKITYMKAIAKVHPDKVNRNKRQ